MVSIPRRPRVVVVGAGLAGLRCAQVLQRNGGVEVTVVECAGYVGGRVRSRVREDGGVLELGAQWVHGTAGNPLVELVQGGVAAVPRKEAEGRVAIRSPAGAVDAEVFERAWRWASSALKECEKGGEGSVGEAVRGRAREMSTEFRACVEHRLRWERTLSACPDAAELDLGSWGEYFERAGPNLRVPRMDVAAAGKLAAAVSDVRLGTRATRIERDGVVVKVQTEGAEVFEAEHVVVTASLGALQRNHILFEPPLDEATRSAIDRLGFGVVEKIAVEFESDWWTELGLRGTWHAVDWVDDAVFGDAVTTWRHDRLIEGAPTVVAWLAGPSAATLGTDDEILGAATRMLARLSDVDVDSDYYKTRIAAKSKLAMRTRWADAPHFGSYSFVKTGASGADVDTIARLRRGISFAGEHTHRTRYSTADGALLSGERAAYDVLGTLLEPPFACVIIQRGDLFFAEVRPATKKDAPGALTCFGGKREPGETAFECALRELGEELAWTPPFLSRACTLHVDGLFIATFFIVQMDDDDLEAEGDPTPVEPGVGAAWVSRTDPNWSPWHKAVLDAFALGSSAASIEDDAFEDLLRMFADLPTAKDYAYIKGLG